MEKRRKGMIKQCLSFALSLVMALTIVTPVKAAQQQYVQTQDLGIYGGNGQISCD